MIDTDCACFWSAILIAPVISNHGRWHLVPAVLHLRQKHGRSCHITEHPASVLDPGSLAAHAFLEAQKPFYKMLT